MGLTQTLSLVSLVAALAVPALAEETKVAQYVPQDGIEYRVKKGTKKPDATLYGLIGEWQKIEGLAKESKWDEVLNTYQRRAEDALSYDFNLLSVEDQKKLGTVFSDIGSAFYGKNDPSDSLTWKELAVELSPYDQLIHRNLALVYKELGKVKREKPLLLQSIDIYKATIRLDPTTGIARECEKAIGVIETKYLPTL